MSRSLKDEEEPAGEDGVQGKKPQVVKMGYAALRQAGPSWL